MTTGYRYNEELFSSMEFLINEMPGIRSAINEPLVLLIPCLMTLGSSRIVQNFVNLTAVVAIYKKLVSMTLTAGVTIYNRLRWCIQW